jgi:desulfoferrodoxin (superoxide reductase-like protein)
MNAPVLNTITYALHSVYAFSSAGRWFEDACSASIRMTKGMKSGTNPAAELGTAAHELGEHCIRYGFSPFDCIGMVFGKYTHNDKDIVVDAEMAEAVNLYVGYANDLQVRTGVKASLEMRVVMLSLGRDDVYGTSDLVLVDLQNRTLYISDYKHGYVVVEAANNKQMIGYGISTLDTLGIWQNIDTVVTTIIQPRKQHIQGCIRSHSYTTAQLVEWQKRFAKSIKLAEDPTTKPIAGEHCHYCVKAKCRARLLYVLNAAFQDAPDDELTDTEIGVMYNHLPVIETFVKRIKEEALTIAKKTGQVPEGMKPVKSIKWAVVNDEKGLIQAVAKEGLDESVLYKKDIISKTAAKKVLPAAIVDKFFIVPPSSTTIAPLSDNRPALRIGSVEGVFKPMKGY